MADLPDSNATRESFRIAEAAEAAAIGLRIASLSQITGRLFYEAPIVANSARLMADCNVGHLTYIGIGSGVTGATIGRFCAIAPRVEIGPAEHPIDWLSVHPFQYSGTGLFKGRVEYESIAGSEKYTQPGRTYIGNDVWIGDGAFVRRGVVVGDGAIVAARAVVTKNVPPYAIVAGAPARVIRYRFHNETIDALMKLRWWDYDLSAISSEIHYSDVHKAVGVIQEAIRTSTVQKLSPETYRIHRGNPCLVEPIS